MNTIDFLASRAFPDFYQEDAENLVQFVQYFVEWASQENNVISIIDNLTTDRDIDNIVDSYLSYLTSETAQDVPLYMASNLRKFLKNVLLLYQSKGTIPSYEYIFRTLYDSFVKVTYPKEKIIRTSDGRWTQGQYIVPNVAGQLTPYIGFKCTGETSEAFGYIDNVLPYKFSGDTEYTQAFRVVNPEGVYIPGENIVLFKDFTESESVTMQIVKHEKGPGYYSGTYGMPSSDRVLQDSYFYQDFSYVLTSLLSLSDYYEIVKKLIHPAGMKLFGELRLYEEDKEYHTAQMSFIRYWIITVFSNITLPAYTFTKDFNIQNVGTGRVSYETLDYMTYNSYLIDMKFLGEDSLVNGFIYQSNKDSNLVFDASGSLVNPNYINWSVYSINPLISGAVYNFYLTPKHFMVEKIVDASGNIYLDTVDDISSNVWIFVDGKKIPDSDVIISESGYVVSSIYATKTAFVYSYSTSDIIWSNKLVLANDMSTTDYISLPNITEPTINNTCVFIDGIFKRTMTVENHKLRFKDVMLSGSSIEIYGINTVINKSFTSGGNLSSVAVRKIKVI